MKHLLAILPYDYAALEPHIDARTTELHHEASERPARVSAGLVVGANCQEAARRFDGVNLSAEPDCEDEGGKRRAA